MLKEQECDPENSIKETFRVFFKDEKGCIPVEEMKFVLNQVCSQAVSRLEAFSKAHIIQLDLLYI